jgi:signal transduction histidine kinase
LEVQPDDLPRLANELETTVFRIIQEALSNVFRHAKAHNVWVTVTLQEGNLMVAIQDDGIGLAEKIVEFRPGSFGVGIGGMRQRALDIGGELRIRNANPGASVEIVIPTNLPCEPKMLV